MMTYWPHSCWWTRHDPLIDRLIKPPVLRYAKADEALPVRAEMRRQVTDRMRQRAAKVEGGTAIAR